MRQPPAKPIVVPIRFVCSPFSKTRPPEDILEAAEAGQLAFGENYEQEAVSKIESIRRSRPDLKTGMAFYRPHPEQQDPFHCRALRLGAFSGSGKNRTTPFRTTTGKSSAAECLPSGAEYQQGKNQKRRIARRSAPVLGGSGLGNAESAIAWSDGSPGDRKAIR